jgi:IS4 transposase
MNFVRHRSQPVDITTGLRSDQIGKLGAAKARRDFPWPLRRVRFHDAQTGKYLIFLTNNLELPALTIAGLYKARWQVELFFRWIKNHLRIKHFFGTSANAVKTQVWTAMATYAMVAIHHKQLGAPGSLFRTTQLLSVHPFEKTLLNELLTETASQSNIDIDSQPLLFNDL